MNIFALVFFNQAFSASFFNVKLKSIVTDPDELKTKLKNLNKKFINLFLYIWSDLIILRLELESGCQNDCIDEKLIQDIKTALNLFKSTNNPNHLFKNNYTLPSLVDYKGKVQNLVQHFEQRKFGNKKIDNYLLFLDNLYNAINKEYADIMNKINLSPEQSDTSECNLNGSDVLNEKNINEVKTNNDGLIRIKELVLEQMNSLKTDFENIKTLIVSSVKQKDFLENLVDDLFASCSDLLDIFIN